jgi:hypothetical protein
MISTRHYHSSTMTHRLVTPHYRTSITLNYSKHKHTQPSASHLTRTRRPQNHQISTIHSRTMNSGTNQRSPIHAHRASESDHRSTSPPPAPRGTNIVDLPDVSPVETEEFMQWMYWREEERKAGRLSETSASTRASTRTTTTTTTRRYQSYLYSVRR